jgi:hypothetical protein
VTGSRSSGAARVGQRQGWPVPSGRRCGHLTSMHWILTSVYMLGMIIDRQSSMSEG